MLKLDKLTDNGRDQFIELIHESLEIRTHFELFHWLHGRLQQYLPHDILIAAWGDFPDGLIYYDVISELPGVRTREVGTDKLARCLKRLHTHWESNGRSPSLLNGEECVGLKSEIDCEVIARHFGSMQSVLVHAIKDFRERNDCLYVLLSNARPDSNRVCTMLEVLLPHIDASLRKVPHLPEQLPDGGEPSKPTDPELDRLPGITPREIEILRLVQIGKTNVEIGMILDISVFTVKNHLQHIFKKLNVSNRVQAVSKF